jgi:hypothetical protein
VRLERLGRLGVGRMVHTRDSMDGEAHSLSLKLSNYTVDRQV